MIGTSRVLELCRSSAAIGVLAATFTLGSTACGDDKPANKDGAATQEVEQEVEQEVDASGDSTPDAEVETPTPVASIRFTLPATGLPEPLMIPFPSDLYRSGAALDGPVVDTLTNWELAGVTQQSDVLRQAYAGLDGFGHTTGALFRIDFADAATRLDVASLPKTGAACLAETSPVAIVDISDAGAVRRLPCIASYFAPLQVLVVAPEGEPLRTGHRYAVVVSDKIAVSGDAGEHLAASSTFLELLAAPRTTPAATLFGTALDRVTTLLPGWAEHVAGMAVYSAHSEHRKLKAVRDALAAGDYGPAPQFLDDTAAAAPYPALRFCAETDESPAAGCTATLDAWLGIARKGADGHDLPGAPGEPGNPEPAATGWPHDALGVVLQGAFPAPEFRSAWDGSPSPAAGNFVFVGGKAQAQPDPVKVPLTIILPRTAPPATGYPVAIFAHGTPTNRQFVMTMANQLARAGIATVAMDGLYHGVRAQGGDDVRNNYPGSYVGPDGFADAASTFFSTIDLSGSLASAPRYRANQWQYALEWCQLRRLLANPAIDLSSVADRYPTGAALHFDASRIGWVGTSFGSFTGAMLLPIETGIKAFFLNVGNGDALQWQGESPDNRGQIELVLFLFGISTDSPLTRFTPFVSVAFGALEPGFAGASTEDVDPAGPDILMTEVEYDESVPNRSTEVLAAALGIPQIVPAARTVSILDSVTGPVTATPGHPARGLVHMGTASHSSNLGRRWGTRSYAFPEALADDVRAPFTRIDPPLWVKQPVIATQAMLVKFLTSTFAGAAVIDASAIPQVIDFDGDGWCDATEQAAGTAWADPLGHPASAPDCTWDPGF